VAGEVADTPSVQGLGVLSRMPHAMDFCRACESFFDQGR
jgi:hypothetical protein